MSTINLGSIEGLWDGPAELAEEAHALAVISTITTAADVRITSALHTLGATGLLALFTERDHTVLASNAEVVGMKEAEFLGSVARLRDAARTFDYARAAGMSLLTAGDIPAQFAELGDAAPFVLWAKTEGDLGAILASLSAGVVIEGARAATSYGEHIAAALANDAVRAKRTVITGGGYGVHSAASRAALAAGGRVVIITTGGADRAYPHGNRDLFERVAENGLIMSESAPACTPTQWLHQARRRLLSVAAPAVVVVEAGFRSGARDTAILAKEAGRFVGGIPGPITSAASTGANSLIRDGVATLITSFQDVPPIEG